MNVLSNLPIRSPFKKLLSYVFQTVIKSQAGIAPIIVLFLLVVAVIGGTYLVQQRTNIMPFALESSTSQTVNGSCASATSAYSSPYKQTDAATGCVYTKKGVSFQEQEGGTKCLVTFSQTYDDPACPSRAAPPPAQTPAQCTPGSRCTNGEICTLFEGTPVCPNPAPKPVVCTDDDHYICTNIISGPGSRCQIVGGKGSCTPPTSCNALVDKNCGAGKKCKTLSGGGTTCEPIGGGAATPTQGRPVTTSSEAGSGGGGSVATVVPTDRDSCKNETACVFSEGNTCKVGLCDEGSTKCGFNSDCRFQNAVSRECISGTKYKIGGSEYKPGDVIDCGQANAAGSAARAAAQSGGSGQTGSPSSPGGVTPTPTPIPLTTREQLYEKCGFIPKNGSNIPLFAVGLGENQEINDGTCKKLQQEQLKNFNSYIEKARAEEEELRKRAEEAKKKGDTAQAEELTKAADELKKKADEAEKKTEECKDKSGQEGIDCLKAAQDPVKEVANEAKVQSIKNALAKYDRIVNGEIPGGCVKADLGITPFLEAQRLKRRGENDEQRRVLLCAGDNDPKQLKWRVMVEGRATGEPPKPGEKDEYATEGEDDDIDEGNNAERIWGLHGESKDATGDPKYPYTTEGKNPVTFENPNSEVGRNVTMGKHLEAARAGKTTLRSAPVPGDDGVEAPCSKGATETCGKTGGGEGGGGSQQPGGGGGECTQSEKDRCEKEGKDYVCTKPNGQYDCSVADKCKEDKDCAGKPEGKTECHRSSGQCIKPRTQSGGGGEDECQDTNQCLSKHGDGWICNSSKKCENDGGRSCTNDEYCKKFGINDTCYENKCQFRGRGSPVFTPLENFFQSLF